MSDSFKIASSLLKDVKHLFEGLKTAEENETVAYYAMQLKLHAKNYFNYLLSLPVLLTLSKNEFEFLRNQPEALYVQIYTLSGSDVQKQIMLIKHHTFEQLILEINSHEDEMKGEVIIAHGTKQVQFNNEVALSMVDVAKKMLPIKFEEVLSKHKNFLFTSGLRDEIHIRFTPNKEAPETLWNRELTLEEKVDLQCFIWDLTQPYLQDCFNQVISCRKFADKVLGLKGFYPMQTIEREKEMLECLSPMQACIQRIKNLCVQAKTPKSVFNMSTIPLVDSFSTLFFSPREWITPRTKVGVEQILFCDFLLFELNELLCKEPVFKLGDLNCFLEKLAVVQQFSLNFEKYPLLSPLASAINIEISNCFDITLDDLNILLNIKLNECKEKCQNLNSLHEPYAIEKIGDWVGVSLAHISPKFIKEFICEVFDVFSQDQLGQKSKCEIKL